VVTGARGQRLRALKTVQFASNEFGFRNGIRQSDTAQRVASFIEPVQFFEQRRPSSMRVRFQRLRSCSSIKTISPFSSKRAGARECCSSSKARRHEFESPTRIRIARAAHTAVIAQTS
jgi:hypothetical protein